MHKTLKIIMLPLMLAVVSATNVQPMGCASDDCEISTELWLEQMAESNGPPCEDELQKSIDTMYGDCGGCPIHFDPNPWGVKKGTEFDSLNNSTRTMVEEFGCSGAKKCAVVSILLSAFCVIAVCIATL